jgi:hypothetical protein
MHVYQQHLISEPSTRGQRRHRTKESEQTFEGDFGTRTLPTFTQFLAQFPAAASQVGASTNVQSFV